jgi:hypothetical protein
MLNFSIRTLNWLQRSCNCCDQLPEHCCFEHQPVLAQGLQSNSSQVATLFQMALALTFFVHATDQGIELVMTKRFDPLTFQTLYTLDTLYGVVMTNPEMAGILLFNQT